MKTFLFTFGTLCFTASATADLIITVTGQSGSGTTDWNFTGSDVAGSDGTFGTGGSVPIVAAQRWENIALDPGITTINDTLLEPGTSSVNVQVDAGPDVNLVGIYVDDDGPGEFDDFGIALSSATPFSAGNSISWSGTAIVPIDISQMVEGTFNANSFAGLDLMITFNAVPEPGSLSLLCASAMGLLATRRRRKIPRDG